MVGEGEFESPKPSGIWSTAKPTSPSVAFPRQKLCPSNRARIFLAVLRFYNFNFFLLENGTKTHSKRNSRPGKRIRVRPRNRISHFLKNNQNLFYCGIY